MITEERAKQLLETIACAYERENNPYADQCAEAMRMGAEAINTGEEGDLPWKYRLN